MTALFSTLSKKGSGGCFKFWGLLRQHSQVMGIVLEKPSVPAPTYKEFFGGYNLRFPRRSMEPKLQNDPLSTFDGVMATSRPVPY